MQRHYLRYRVKNREFVAISEFINNLENIVMNYICESFPKVWDVIDKKNKSCTPYREGNGIFSLDCEQAIRLIYKEQRYVEKNEKDAYISRIPKRSPYYRLSDIIHIFVMIENVAEKLKEYTRLNEYFSDKYEYSIEFTNEIDASKRNLVEAISETIKILHWKMSSTYSEEYGYKEEGFTFYIAGRCLFPISSITKDMKKHCYDYVDSSGMTIKYEKRGLRGDLLRSSRIEKAIRKYIFQDDLMDDKQLARSLTKPLEIRHKQIIDIQLAKYTEKQKVIRERVVPLVKNNTELSIALRMSEVEVKKTQEMLKLVESERDEALKLNSLQENTLFRKDREISDLKVNNKLLQQEVLRNKSSIQSRKK